MQFKNLLTFLGIESEDDDMNSPRDVLCMGSLIIKDKIGINPYTYTLSKKEINKIENIHKKNIHLFFWLISFLFYSLTNSISELENFSRFLLLKEKNIEDVDGEDRCELYTTLFRKVDSFCSTYSLENDWRRILEIYAIPGGRVLDIKLFSNCVLRPKEFVEKSKQYYSEIQK